MLVEFLRILLLVCKESSSDLVSALQKFRALAAIFLFSTQNLYAGAHSNQKDVENFIIYIIRLENDILRVVYVNFDLSELRYVVQT